MKKILKTKSEFGRNVLTLVTGTTISQAIPIAITPILTRLYTPEDFGLLALFVSITAILGSIANGRYELAIMLPRSDEDVINIAALGMIINLTISFCLLVLIVLFNEQIASFLGNTEIRAWLYLVPLVVLLIGLHNLLNYLATRRKLYKQITGTQIYKSTCIAIVQLGVGVAKGGVSGLIGAQISAEVLSNFLLSKKLRESYGTISINMLSIKRMAKRYSNFPKFSMWAILANNIATHLTSIFVSVIFNVSTLGFYSLAQKMLGMPSSLVGSAISQVFFKEATDERNRTGKVIVAFDKTLKNLILLSIPIFGILVLIVEDVFYIIFGPDWSVAGEYAVYLTPMFAIRFIISVVTPVDTVMEKQNYFLFFNLVLLFVTLMIFVLTSSWGFEVLLVTFSAAISAVYLCYGFILRKMAKNEL